MLRKFRKSASGKLAGIVSLLSMAAMAPSAFAQGTGIGTTVTTLVNEYKEEALIAIVAYIVAKWALTATGILRPKG
jgi:Na+/proline symporter